MDSDEVPENRHRAPPVAWDLRPDTGGMPRMFGRLRDAIAIHGASSLPAWVRMTTTEATRSNTYRAPRWMRLAWWTTKRSWQRFQTAVFTRARYSEPKMRWMGALGVFGFPAYYLVWAKLLPQPYESLSLRLFGSLLFLPLMLVRYWPRRLKSWLPLYWYLAMTFALPFFFSYMLLQNGANVAWLLSHLCSVFLMVMLFDMTSFLVTSFVGTVVAVITYLLAPAHPLAADALLAYSPVWAFAILSGSVFSISHSMSNQARIDAIIAATNNIAHELRTPLASVRIATQAVHRFLPLLAESHRKASLAGLAVPDLRDSQLGRLSKAMDTIGREVEHANTVIDMLLVAARPIGELQMEKVSARDCLVEAMERYPFGSQHERSRVSADTTGDFEFTGSRLLVVHVIFNLIKNALFHTGRAGKGTITLSVANDAEGRRIVCHDTGPGIPADVLPHIFERFYSSATDYSTGLGVGLSFVRMALERMGATITCRSTFGEFTEFTLSFPLILESES
ncbi:sensor histidine kinase [Tahibacter amnicola]|uniref:histidine kinase n=1 Tax=Tahibacter amnicola TaxID=2976241 RepID=A0ABY6BA11_9GAMM|nr:HAMP domain-containing sensor histidine kinase [Tahibacter amnicola]UXI66704.1 HAMP domain-containing histidine kinase [Tahibacter amnicola]